MSGLQSELAKALEAVLPRDPRRGLEPAELFARVRDWLPQPYAEYLPSAIERAIREMASTQSGPVAVSGTRFFNPGRPYQPAAQSPPQGFPPLREPPPSLYPDVRAALRELLPIGRANAVSKSEVLRALAKSLPGIGPHTLERYLRRALSRDASIGGDARGYFRRPSGQPGVVAQTAVRSEGVPDGMSAPKTDLQAVIAPVLESVLPREPEGGLVLEDLVSRVRSRLPLPYRQFFPSAIERAVRELASAQSGTVAVRDGRYFNPSISRTASELELARLPSVAVPPPSLYSDVCTALGVILPVGRINALSRREVLKALEESLPGTNLGTLKGYLHRAASTNPSFGKDAQGYFRRAAGPTPQAVHDEDIVNDAIPTPPPRLPQSAHSQKRTLSAAVSRLLRDELREVCPSAEADAVLPARLVARFRERMPELSSDTIEAHLQELQYGEAPAIWRTADGRLFLRPRGRGRPKGSKSKPRGAVGGGTSRSKAASPAMTRTSSLIVPDRENSTETRRPPRNRVTPSQDVTVRTLVLPPALEGRLTDEQRETLQVLVECGAARTSELAQRLKRSPLRLSGMMRGLRRMLHEEGMTVFVDELLPNGEVLYKLAPRGGDR